jgi:hypothetical protein
VANSKKAKVSFIDEFSPLANPLSTIQSQDTTKVALEELEKSGNRS